MAQQHFGNRLAEARRRRGLTLEQVHRQLRITPAILEALEMADFRQMPFKGHARNMVSSYARYLGLNSEDVTKQFLKEYHDYESHEARQGSLSYGSINLDPFNRDEPMSSSRNMNSDNSRSTRSIWDRPIPNSDLSRGYTSRTSTTRRMTTPSQERRSRTDEGPMSSRYGTGGYQAKPSLPLRIFGTIFRSPVVLIVFLIVVLVALLVLWAMVANSCKTQENVVTPGYSSIVQNGDSSINTEIVPVPDNSSSEEPDPRYGPFELVVEPVAGEAPWVSVSVDGADVYYDFLSEKKTWQVTKECTVITGQPQNTKVYRNGEEATIVINPNEGLGSVTIKVIEPPG